MSLLSRVKTAVLIGVAILAAPVCSAQTAFPRQALCVSCHGAQGKSDIQGIPSLAGQPKLFIENQLVLMREGVREVPAMKGMLDGLTDDEAIAIAKYYAALPLNGIPADKDPQLFAQGEKLAQGMRCGICHLPNYVGRDQIPRLAGQRDDFLLHSLLQFRNGQAIGRDSNMAAAVIGVSDADLAALSYYFARITP
jgi:cytochrome c553